MTAPEGISLEEAIKILTPSTDEHCEASVQEVEQAERLGIAALERIDNVRNVGNEMPGALLPGEIKEKRRE